MVRHLLKTNFKVLNSYLAIVFNFRHFCYICKKNKNKDLDVK